MSSASGAEDRRYAHVCVTYRLSVCLYYLKRQFHKYLLSKYVFPRGNKFEEPHNSFTKKILKSPIPFINQEWSF